MSTLIRYAMNKYSQNGEDGVIAEVMRRLGIFRGTFVEFGAGDGISLSNTLALAEKGWRGVWIEADTDSAAKAEVLAGTFHDGRVEVLREYVGLVGEKRLDVMLARTKLDPGNLDFMSIDIDSYDLEVWESIEQFRAKVVLIEINSSVPVGVLQRHGGGCEGASFTSTVNSGQERGYTLVCHTGNLLFVDKALVHKIGLPERELQNPAVLFNDAWVRGAEKARGK